MSDNMNITLEEYEDSIISSTTDLNGIITHASNAFCKLSGYSRSELLGFSHNIVRHTDMPNIIYIELWKKLKNKESWFGILKNKNKQGDSYWVKTVISPKYNSEMKHIGYTSIRQDITKEMQVSTIDLNCLKEAVFSKEYKYVGVLEFTNISQINDELSLIQTLYIKEKFEQKISLMNSEKINIYKGVSNKYIVLSKEHREGFLRQDFQYFLNQLKDFTKDYFNEQIECFIGLALIKDFESLNCSINAELALTLAKENNEEIFIFNEDNIHVQKMVDNLNWKEKTKYLVLEEEIYPFFQPILNIETNKVEKYEVLARGKLNHEFISPFFFISHAEHLGLIKDITKIIVNKSFKFFKDKNIEFSINISEKDLKDRFFIPFLKKSLDIYNMNPALVTLEILENITFSEDSKLILDQLEKLRLLGFKLAIDDFGSDNSNFSRLLNINIDILKIDALFIKNIDKNEKNKTIVKSIVNMAKTLGIKTIAEFVENEAIMTVIKECGVDYAQGYFIGKPEEYLI